MTDTLWNPALSSGCSRGTSQNKADRGSASPARPALRPLTPWQGGPKPATVAAAQGGCATQILELGLASFASPVHSISPVQLRP